MEHELKTWPGYFTDIAAGYKTFELRRDDRGFNVGDVLRLREYDPEANRYTGRELRKGVAHILRHRPGTGCAAEFGLAPGYAILSLSQF